MSYLFDSEVMGNACHLMFISFRCQNANKAGAKPQISNTLICYDGEEPYIMNIKRGQKALRLIEKSLILLAFLNLVFVATDQKVGGSNPSGRAKHIRPFLLSEGKALFLSFFAQKN